MLWFCSLTLQTYSVCCLMLWELNNQFFWKCICLFILFVFLAHLTILAEGVIFCYLCFPFVAVFLQYWTGVWEVWKWILCLFLLFCVMILGALCVCTFFFFCKNVKNKIFKKRVSRKQLSFFFFLILLRCYRLLASWSIGGALRE